MKQRNLNFLSSERNVRPLQLITLTAVIGSVAMSSALLLRNNGGTASISDTLASASFSVQPAPTTTAKPKAISEHGVISASQALSGDMIRYYEKDSGKAFAVTLPTQRTDVLSDKRLPGFIRAYWIPRTNSVVSAFQQPSGTEYRFYDYDSGDSISLGFGITDVAVSPDGRSIASVKKNSDDSYSVALSAVDGADAEVILTTRAGEPRLTWRSSGELAMTSRRQDRPGYDLTLVDKKGGLRPLLSNKEGLEALWSPDGNYLLYSYFSPDSGVSLWLRSVLTNEEVNLGIYTGAHKCAWHPGGLIVTCGVPMKKSLARDVPAAQTATVDDIYTYDFDRTTLRLDYAGVSSSLIGVTEPLISSSGDYFVFTNMFNSRLYALPL